MLRNIKLTIEYDGTNFNGWQFQPGLRTIQGEIQNFLKKIFKEDITLIGSGRTDSGVHAKGQVANFRTTSTMSTLQMCRAFNNNLPEDIAILSVEEVNLKFHAQHSAKRKTYRYTILNREPRSSLQRNFCLRFPYKLNLTLMRQEAKALVGRKDFKAFQAASSTNPKDSIRRVYKLKITKQGDFIYIDIEANGFLYKMVRNIVGTLLEIGSGRLPKGSIKRILKSKDRTTAGDTTQARGLCLLHVKY